MYHDKINHIIFIAFRDLQFTGQQYKQGIHLMV